MEQTLVELKAEAFDALVNIEKYQAKLREVNQKIASYQVEPETTEETK